MGMTGEGRPAGCGANGGESQKIRLTLLIADEAPRLKQTFASEMDGERARARGSYDST